MQQRIGFVGVGAIASALVDGLCAAGAEPGVRILLSPRGAETVAELSARHPGLIACPDNQTVADGADVVVLAVPPGAAADAARSMRLRPGTLVVSAVAGVRHEALAAQLGDHVTVIRAIPLPGARRGSSPTVLHPAHPVAGELFGRLGDVLEASDEQELDAFSTATATLSTLVSYLQHVAEWLAQHHVSPAVADAYVRTMAGSTLGGLTSRSTGLSQLLAQHETPGGLNEQLRHTWFDSQNRRSLHTGLDQVHQRVRGESR